MRAQTRQANGQPGVPIAPPSAFMSPSEDRFELLPLYRVRESEDNPRKQFDTGRLQELAQSIRQHGVIEPIIVRRHPKPLADEDYELICGARRLRASALAGQTRIPALIRDMSDKDVLEVMCIENANREDVHPLEEGEAFLQLLREYGSTVAQISEKIGKSDRYVQRRLKLATLIPAAKEIYLDGKLTLEHFNILARLEPSSQEKALPKAWRRDFSRYEGADNEYPPDYSKPLTAKEFEEAIRTEFFLSLKSAPWDLTDPKLDPAAGSCASCTKRSGASPLLFDEAEKADHCLDAACFDSKRKLYLIESENAAKQSGSPLVRVATTYISTSDQKALDCLPSHGAFEKVTKSNRCQHTQRAVVVVGDNIGTQFDICANKKCKQHVGKEAGSGSFHGSPEEQRRRAESQRKREESETFIHALAKGILAKVPKQPGRRELLVVARELLNAGTLEDIAELLGMDELPKSGWKAERNAFCARLEASSDGEIGRALIAMCLSTMVDNSTIDDPAAELIQTAKEYGVDPKAIEKEARATVAAKYAEEEKPVKSGAVKPSGKVSRASRQKKAAVAAGGGDWDEDFNQEAGDDDGL